MRERVEIVLIIGLYENSLGFHSVGVALLASRHPPWKDTFTELSNKKEE